MRGIRRNKNFFCSKQCLHEHMTISNPITVSCANCASQITRLSHEMSQSKSGNFFCDRSCAATYNNSKYPKREKKIKSIPTKSPKPPKLPQERKCLSCSFTLDSKRIYCDRCRPAIISAKSKEHWDSLRASFIIQWKKGEVDGSKGEGQVSSHIRKYLFEKYQSKCSECGWARINPATNKIPLEIDHIDGDWNNHKEENLRLLCPSCHSITPTFRSLNNGHGRTNRLLKLNKQVGGSGEIQTHGGF
jgi:hypothetical protein